MTQLYFLGYFHTNHTKKGCISKISSSFGWAIAITRKTRKSRNPLSGEFRVIVFAPIHKNDNSDFFYDTWNNAWK